MSAAVMASYRVATATFTAGDVGSSRGAGFDSKRMAASFSSSRSSVLGRPVLPALTQSHRPLRASPASLICVAATWWSDVSREIQPIWKKVHSLSLEELKRNESTRDVPQVETTDVSLWNNLQSGAESMFSAGFTPEVVIGRTAMLGFLAATTVEFETGKSVLQQLTFRGDIFATVVAVGVLLMSLRRKDEDGSVATFDPSGLFTPTAERLNGQAAMLGFALLVATESAKGSALF